jgi:hypothetical protein
VRNPALLLVTEAELVLTLLALDCYNQKHQRLLSLGGSCIQHCKRVSAYVDFFAFTRSMSDHDGSSVILRGVV